uniref:Uncharacterized protein n=1 Tax=Vespula pensylvanica TaxID=30213 RepID=A0A834JJD1_VESPE|nr:hypothetical protein H0235_018012 [Vespula pensylvanica]
MGRIEIKNVVPLLPPPPLPPPPPPLPPPPPPPSPSPLPPYRSHIIFRKRLHLPGTLVRSFSHWMVRQLT